VVGEHIIGVISDTHLIVPEMGLSALFETGGIFDGIDILIHAGDFTSPAILSYFKEMKAFAFIGVCGNMDHTGIRSELPDKNFLEVSQYRIGVMHGWGAPLNLDKKIYRSFKNTPAIACIVFGHTHQPANRLLNETLMFNPGAFKRGPFTNQRTVGKLFVSSSGIRGEIIPVF